MGTAIDISHLRSIKDRFSFEGKKGFVTGAAGGIGRSTAAALAELGADVALVDINLERARQNAEEINKRFCNYVYQNFPEKRGAIASRHSRPVLKTLSLK